jgi:hypothetical protein
VKVEKAMHGKLDKSIGKVTFSIPGFKENTNVIPSMDKFGTLIFKSPVRKTCKTQKYSTSYMKYCFARIAGKTQHS